MNVQIEESWKARLEPEFEKDYFHTLTDFVREEYSHYPIYPPGKLIFNAFNLCPFDKVKVVIIGQDPYHGPGQAHGLCFSVNWKSDPLGRARCPAPECNPNCPCPSGRFSSEPRLGDFYGRRHTCPCRTA